MILAQAETEVKEVVIMMSTDEISNLINTNKDFRKLLKSFKGDNVEGFKCTIKNEYKNGLTNSLYCMIINGKLISIIVPVFSGEKTITWDIRFASNVRNAIMDTDISNTYPHLANLTDADITKLTICPLFKLIKKTNLNEGEIILKSNVYLSDWLNTGYKGRNGFSVYFMTDRIPDKSMVTAKAIETFMFVKSLQFLGNKELKVFCLTYAETEYIKFAGVERNAKTKIKNISDGLYAEIKTYLLLVNAGYNVTMDWCDGDDLGIDIQYYTNNTYLNIDVKSTKTEYLKISKNRAETDFYAICTWEKSEPVLFGFLFKPHFWKSNILGTIAPQKVGEMYQKSLADIQKDVVNIDKLYNMHTNYNILKAKKSTNKLFNND